VLNSRGMEVAKILSGRALLLEPQISVEHNRLAGLLRLRAGH